MPVDLSALVAPTMAITQSGLALLLDQARRLASGAAGVSVASARRPTSPAPAGVRRIQIIGPITHRQTWIGQLLGWPSIAGLKAEFDEALADPSVQTILLEIESPGGVVYGTGELAATIHAARNEKRIVAYAAAYAASAAYWLGAAASEFYAMPSGEVGSIGVIAIHFDESRAWDAAGITPTILTTSQYKKEFTPLEPLSSESKAYALEQMGAYHRAFVNAIARYRGTNPKTVEAKFGQGRTLLANNALAVGMIDGIAASLAEVLSRRPGQVRSGSSAHAQRVARAEADIAEAILRAS